MEKPHGIVYLVGAGPGDPGLLTLRGQACLAAADLVLYDYLVNPRLLEHAPDDAECICMGRHGQSSQNVPSHDPKAPRRLSTQQEINTCMVTAAQAGRTVVRLKGGDPAIFGRAAEETMALEAAEIPYVSVPGITTALATGSYAGIPLTHREIASCVALVTGQQSAEAPPVDYGALATFPGTLVFYMGVTTAPVWVQALLDAGKKATTPVAVVRHCSLPRQFVFRTTLGELPAQLVQRNIRPPAMIVIGEVTRAQARFDWFAHRPLSGQQVLVTRPMGQAAGLVEQLDQLGAQVLCQPAIEILPTDHWEPVDTLIGKLETFNWCVFSSANGVRFFLDRLLHLGHDLRSLGNLRIATVGPATTRALNGYHLNSDSQPDVHHAEGLAEDLASQAGNQHFLLVRADRGRPVLAEVLQEAGGKIEQAIVYRSQDVLEANREIADALSANQIDWITVTSSAIARSLIRLFGEELGKAKLAAISPRTADVLTQANYPPQAVATDYTSEGIIQAIVEHGG